MMRPRHAIILATLSLLGLGVLMVHSAGLRVGTDAPLTVDRLVFGPVAGKAIGALVLLTICAHLPVARLGDRRWFRTPIPWLAAVSTVLLVVVLIPGIGTERNGAMRWLDIGPGFQPSELAKWTIPAALGWWAIRMRDRMHRFMTGVLPPLALLGIATLLIGKEDLGTAVLLAAVGSLVLLAGGARILHFAAFAPLAVVGVIVAVAGAEYRMKRLQAFRHPFEDPEGINYHVIQSLAAIHAGGPAGRGLGNGVQKFGYLPEDTTDFVFSNVCDELGLSGATLVLFLFSVLIVAGLGVIARSRSPFARLLSFGVMLVIGLQSLINLFVVTAMAPTKGIALPLISQGGTGWWMTACALGLLVAIDRETDERMGPASTSAADADGPECAESPPPIGMPVAASEASPIETPIATPGWT
ncbi:MAG: FtsW/RodA/SpoVE family cell cycle protein [Phycisphaerales bacterium]